MVISQDLPDFWFYRSAPALRLKQWSDLEKPSRSSWPSPAGWRSCIAASRRWWDEVAGPPPMADTIGAILNGEHEVADVAARRR